MTKKIIWIAILLILVAGGFWGYKKWSDDRLFKKFQAGGEKALTAKEYNLKLPEILIAKEKEDTYGSTTPEGTLEMFMKGLEENDAKIASLFYVLEDQDDEFVRIESALAENSDNVKRLIFAYKNGTVISDILKPADNAEINIYYNDDELPYYFQLRLNKYTNVWKLKSI